VIGGKHRCWGGRELAGHITRSDDDAARVDGQSSSLQVCGQHFRRMPQFRQSSQRPLAVLDFVHLRVTQKIFYFRKAKLRLSYLEKDLYSGFQICSS
jgi:hypothetical protein